MLGSTELSADNVIRAAKAAGSRVIAHSLSSGSKTPTGSGLETLWAEAIHVPGSVSLRLVFSQVVLAPHAFVRVTNLVDGEIQVLDARGMRDWNHTSAYFNGDTLLVELVGNGPGMNHVNIAGILIQEPPTASSFNGADQPPCGQCGETDDRLPSEIEGVCRFLPTICTGIVYNEQSCVLAAGACSIVPEIAVAQFRVPPSQNDCSVVHPSVDDQFPVLAQVRRNDGPGASWNVVTLGRNGELESPVDRYGVVHVPSDVPPLPGADVLVAGYGLDEECARSQTLQVAGGTIGSIGDQMFDVTADIAGGSAGSLVLQDGAFIGMVTHCPCPNTAQRIDEAGIQASLEGDCLPASLFDECEEFVDYGIISDGSGIAMLSTEFATTDEVIVDFPSCAVANPTPVFNDIWVAVRAPMDGIMSVSTCPSLTGLEPPTFDDIVVIYGPYTNSSLVSCDSLLTLSCDLDVCEGRNDSDGVVLQSTVTMDRYYLLQIGSLVDGETGTTGLRVQFDEAPILTAPCCLPSGACSNVFVQSCMNVGGVPMDIGTLCADILCPTLFGACCLPAGCQFLDNRDCLDAGGTFGGEGTICSEPDICRPIPGACCFDDGSCEFILPDDCTFAGGIPQSRGQPCDPCLTPPGACCLVTGECGVIDADSCEAFGGIPQGAFIPCEAVFCPEFAACCFADGACSFVDPRSCLSNGGVPQGDNTNCMPNPCVNMLGACCVGDACVVEIEANCILMGGEFQGVGALCLVATCSTEEPGACCTSVGCLQLTPTFCGFAGGTFIGSGTACTDDPCGEGGP
ncbi:MAG: hypothetical protein AAF432_04800 [Planctomycetota bacterium]